MERHGVDNKLCSCTHVSVLLLCSVVTWISLMPQIKVLFAFINVCLTKCSHDGTDSLIPWQVMNVISKIKTMDVEYQT